MDYNANQNKTILNKLEQEYRKELSQRGDKEEDIREINLSVAKEIIQSLMNSEQQELKQMYLDSYTAQYCKAIIMDSKKMNLSLMIWKYT